MVEIAFDRHTQEEVEIGNLPQIRAPRPGLLVGRTPEQRAGAREAVKRAVKRAAGLSVRGSLS